MAPSLTANENGQKALEQQPDAVKAALQSGKPLYEVATDLGILSGGDAKEMKAVGEILKAMTPEQQDEIRTAVIAALDAKRKVDYACTITDPGKVVTDNPSGPKINVAVKPPSDRLTTISFVPVT